MIRKIREWVSIQLAKNPGKMVLIGILIFNLMFFGVAALIISTLKLSGTEHMSFPVAVYHTVTMVLDAGCIDSVIEEVGTSGVALVIVCLVIVLLGMITFTGAVIGYVTNAISSFIENANTGARRLRLSDHTVILNWNTRASEIINDLLFSPKKEKVVVLVNSRKEEIKKEIDERLSETTAKENKELREKAAGMPFFARKRYIHKNKIKWNVTYIVREGDVFSLKQLRDIQLERAKAIVILGSDINNDICRFETAARRELTSKGNSQTIKTLMQVSDITAAKDSADHQRIIVEITDLWTYDIVRKIIANKIKDDENKVKCNIVPVFVNQILGQILSQFSLMPELNTIYRDLFSNKGAAFYAEEIAVDDEDAYVAEYLRCHRHAIPLAAMDDGGTRWFYYVSDDEKSIDRLSPQLDSNYTVKLKESYNIDKKNIIILGHNSDTEEIMKGFAAFACEWDYIDMSEMILRVTVVDDKEHLEKVGYYRHYPFVAETVVADIYDEETICDTINRVVSYTDGDTSVLILSDDAAINDDIDSNALANLIYVQDIIREKQKKQGKDFDPGAIDVIVEIIDPKHHDVVNSYDVNNVVISNRYISKMITQIGEKEAIYNFYNDILTYDVDTSEGFESKEVYVKKVSAFFDELPAPCTAFELIRAVYFASISEKRPAEKRIPNMLLGYVKANGEMTLFTGDQTRIPVTLEKDDKIIVYSTH